jgi:putative transposase
MTLAYSSGLTDEQWELLASQLPAPKSTGRPRTVDLHQVINAILYVLTTSCAWYLLPKDLPPYSTVYYYFRQWRDDGTWQRVHDHLVQWVRVLEDHPSTPSAASLDAQSVPTAVMVNESVGYDAAKKIKGRKRFTLVDTFGLLLSVHVVAANVPEREGAKQLLQKVEKERERFPR